MHTVVGECIQCRCGMVYGVEQGPRGSIDKAGKGGVSRPLTGTSVGGNGPGDRTSTGRFGRPAASHAQPRQSGWEA